MSASERRYCRTCGPVEPEHGRHPEYGPVKLCPNGGFEHTIFESKAALIEHDHESALLETGRPLPHLEGVL